jgi:hypothetical protein
METTIESFHTNTNPSFRNIIINITSSLIFQYTSAPKVLSNTYGGFASKVKELICKGINPFEAIDTTIFERFREDKKRPPTQEEITRTYYRLITQGLMELTARMIIPTRLIHHFAKDRAPRGDNYEPWGTDKETGKPGKWI